MKNRYLYPPTWDEVSLGVKQEAEWKCELCGEPNNKDTWHILTTAHIIPIGRLIKRWNLIAVCQRCHVGTVEKFSQKLKYLRRVISNPITEEELKALKVIALLTRKEIISKKCNTLNSSQMSLFGATEHY